MIDLVLLRHGESIWNRENRFTGWTDVDLTERGAEEARRAGRLLAAEGHAFDVAYTSLLKRAIRTLWLVLDEMDLMWVPVHRSWRLNERHYGALQGLDKAQTAAEFGDAQVLVWRRSYSTPPPALVPGDERHPAGDPRYAGLTGDELPLTECLRDTVERFLPFWHQRLVPELKAGRRLLIAAPRELLAGAGQAPRRHLRRGDSRLEHPDRRSARVSSRRRSERRLPPVPGRSGRSPPRHGIGRGAGQGGAGIGDVNRDCRTIVPIRVRCHESVRIFCWRSTTQ